MPGFGITAFGLTASGFGSTASQPAPGSGYTPTVDSVLSRKIDFPAKDYVVDYDATGCPHESQDPVAQQVAFRLTTRLGRLTYAPDFGNDWLNLGKAPADLAGFGLRSAALALQDLVNASAVQIVSVEVERDGGTAIQAVTWLDLRTRRERTTRTRRA